MIDHSTIERVMETANSQIVEVITDYISLKKRGVNYLGNCPFHNEKTPSFIVSPGKGIFKCFGCGKGGNALNFVMEHDHLTYVEAIKQLGRKFNIEVVDKEASPEQQQLKDERESMMVVTDFASRYFADQLWASEEGQTIGLSYFRERGFRDDIIKKFQLGYSPQTKDALTSHALKHKYKLEYLEKTGLTIIGENNYQADRFRGRVMFPIHNLSGKVTAFGGRVMKTDAKTAKYLNSPESDIYHKSRIVYGIFQAKQEIVKQDRCYLVEGYTDVLSMHQTGIANVVASSGTALTPDQIRLIARFTPNITVLYDGDNAGIKASLRGIDLILTEGMNVKVLLLPDGDDPDSFARKHTAEEFIQYIRDNETDFIKFKTGLLLKDAENDPVQRARLIQEIVGSITIIPDPILRSLYVKECSTLMKVEEQVLYNEINKIQRQKLEKAGYTGYASQQYKPAPPVADIPINTSNNPFENEEREVLRFLLKYSDELLITEEVTEETHKTTVGQYILNELRSDGLRSVNPLYNLVLEEYEQAQAAGNEPIAMRFFVNHANAEISQLASDLLGNEYTLSKIHLRFTTVKHEKELLISLVPKVVAELKLKKVKHLIDECRLKLQQIEKEGNNEEQWVKQMQELMMWEKVKGVISQTLGYRTIV
ncbi:MAG: DNA primase [Breznakibacter sp.]